MKEPLTQFQYPDLDVANSMSEGFLMMGLPGTNGAFGKKHPEDVTHGADPKWLDHMAKPMTEELLESLQTTIAPPMNQAVPDLTCKAGDSEIEITKG